VAVGKLPKKPFAGEGDGELVGTVRTVKDHPEQLGGKLSGWSPRRIGPNPAQACSGLLRLPQATSGYPRLPQAWLGFEAQEGNSSLGIGIMIWLYYDPKTANLGTVHDDVLTLKVFP
jgi:hypothetical protein